MGSFEKPLKMKSLLILPLISAVQIEHQCSTPFVGDADETKLCNSNFRTFNVVKNFIEEINCPQGENSANPICAGMTNPKKANKFWSYAKLVNMVLENYGCNCFPDNKAIPNVEGKSYNHRLPGINGQPIDELDVACHRLARRHTCLEIDFGPASGLEFQHPSRPVCDYVQGYTYVSNPDTNEIICGGLDNPNYQRDDLYWANYANADAYWNMNKCRYAICSMEYEFAQSVAHIFEDPYNFYLANKGNKDISESAKCVSKTGPKSDMCCGIPEERKPYSSQSSTVCCNDELVEVGSAEEAFLCS